MRNSLSICIIIMMSVFFLAGWTTKQKGLVVNTPKYEVISQLEDFVISNGYEFKYANPHKGLFQIFVKETRSGGYFYKSKKHTHYVPETVTEWEFSIQIAEKGNDVEVYGTSRGGIAPGQYFKDFFSHLKDRGYVAYNHKELKNNPQLLSQYNTQANIYRPVSNNGYNFNQMNRDQRNSYSYQPYRRSSNNTFIPASQNKFNYNELSRDEKVSIELILNKIELKGFGKTNAGCDINERLSILELHYFDRQLTGMSIKARIKALQNRSEADAPSTTAYKNYKDFFLANK